MQGSKIDFLNLNKGHFQGIQYCYKIQELKADIMTNLLVCSKIMGVKDDLVQNCAGEINTGKLQFSYWSENSASKSGGIVA